MIIDVPPISNEGEGYSEITENTFVKTEEENVSTFSIDVDTASYANFRSTLEYELTPNPNSIRIEEFINYFDYNYELPSKDVPFSITTKVTNSPWNESNNIVMIGLQGMVIPKEDLPPSNIVLLIDVSGSMNDANKLPLLKESFKKLIENLDSRDRISMVVYAGSAGVVLEGADGNNAQAIMNALDKLEAGGSTAGGEGIELAYKVAKKYFIEGGNNRVILATDGDFNVGMSSISELEEYISIKRNEGIFLTVIGFGRVNIQDGIMETLADKGNGNYFYIDTQAEANKIFTEELTGTLFAIAKDVKIQVEFNSEYIDSYRLIGYENRVMNNEDFEDDTKDAGELGAGHTVTALYEVVPKEGVDLSKLDDDYLTIRLRYKEIEEDVSKEIAVKVDSDNYINGFDNDLAFAMAVAEFGMIARNSQYKGNASLEHVKFVVNRCLEEKYDEYRAGFLELISKYEKVMGY